MAALAALLGGLCPPKPTRKGPKGPLIPMQFFYAMAVPVLPALALIHQGMDIAAMRADATQLQEQITASVSLLRRHL